MTVPPPVSPPGWYPDPSNPSRRIYWNGAEWVQSHARHDDGGNKASVAVGACVLVAIGFVMSMQSVSLMTGSGLIWTGAAVAAGGTAVAFILRGATWVRVVACIFLSLAVLSAVFTEVQLSDKRAEMSRIFDR